VQYAKSKSHFVAKLDGTFKIPGSDAGAANVTQTELQQSIFNAPPPGTAPPPSKPPTAADHAMRDTASPESRGQKRTRDEEEDEDEDSGEDVAMEEDSDADD
jgi:hypothetical protein